MLLGRRGLNLRMRYLQMKKLLITWTSSWKNQSSIFLLQNQSLMTSPENWQQWSQMLPELQRELMLLRRKLLTLRRSSELWDRIFRPWRLGGEDYPERGEISG